MNVLFVCKSNVGRSQAAEAYFNRLSKKHHATSAAARYDGRKEMDIVVKHALAEEGISTEGQKPKSLTPEMVKQADRIVAMCKREESPPYLLNSEKVEFWNIEDVKGMPEDVKRRNIAEVKGHVLKLLEEIE